MAAENTVHCSLQADRDRCFARIANVRRGVPEPLACEMKMHERNRKKMCSSRLGHRLTSEHIHGLLCLTRALVGSFALPPMIRQRRRPRLKPLQEAVLCSNKVCC